MTVRRMREKRLLTEDVVSSGLCVSAARRGLRTPKTAEEVAAFEEQFADDIKHESARLPDLTEVAARARQLRASGINLRPMKSTDTSESRLQMAARNGVEISPVIEDRMKEALAKARSERKEGDGC